VRKFLEKSPGPLGISSGYNEKTKTLNAIAVVGEKFCLVVEFEDRKPRRRRGGRGGDRNRSGSDEDSERSEEEAVPTVEPKELSPQLKALQQVFEHPAGLFAFDIATLALALYSDYGLTIHAGVDLQSGEFEPQTDKGKKGKGKGPSRGPGNHAKRLNPFEAILACVGDAVKVHGNNITSIFRDLTYQRFTGNSPHNPTLNDMMMRAWVSRFLPTFQNGPQTFDSVPRVDLRRFEHTLQQLDVLGKLAGDAFRLDYLQPLQTVHQISGATIEDEILHVKNDKFSNRLRPYRDVKVEIQNQQGARYNVSSRSTDMYGRDVTLPKNKISGSSQVTAVTSYGRGAPTAADRWRAALILRILQGDMKALQENPWITNIWFSKDVLLSWPDSWQRRKSDRALTTTSPALNDSQTLAVNHMLSPANEHRMVLVQGPPGTGKTSVIANYVTTSVNAGGKGIWLIAQSNVAVKNIAEKLLKEDFLDWKLIVSKDFHFEWHEHLYQELSANMIRDDELREGGYKQLKDCKVILCTLSMLSDTWKSSNFMRYNPIETLIVDEASQIEIGNYFHPFDMAKNTLRKVCFIGDNKQLPPYGQEQLSNLRSIFEVEHLRGQIDFLDTQYRMPPQIGQFISDHVYNKQLKSNPLHPIKDEVLACRLVDASGKEERDGDGKTMSKSFKEANRSFRIVTPYDGQRNYIESEMKKADMAWEDTCFNVDSFQGNEEDYIIISLVRSRSIGFLTNLRRTNVMLSRCKKGMIVVTSRAFLSGVGSHSLVGDLMRGLEERLKSKAWLSKEEIEAGRFWGE
ncbi:hypothetical protein V5O48_008733, partial [Marasmius crinis-equi]